MSNSLRDQLLGLGYKPAPKPERKPEPAPAPKRPHVPLSAPKPNAFDHQNKRPPQRQHKPSVTTARTQEEIDLGKAYALRAQKEKDDRLQAERIKQEEAKKRREAKTKLTALLKDKTLNDPNAEIVRHFPYGGKIKRIYVTAEQLKVLNSGELGVAQMDGRYLLVPIALLLEAEAIFPPVVALKIDPNAPSVDDPYCDPAYQVPDDLVW